MIKERLLPPSLATRRTLQQLSTVPEPIVLAVWEFRVEQTVVGALHNGPLLLHSMTAYSLLIDVGLGISRKANLLPDLFVFLVFVWMLPLNDDAFRRMKPAALS